MTLTQERIEQAVVGSIVVLAAALGMSLTWAWLMESIANSQKEKPHAHGRVHHQEIMLKLTCSDHESSLWRRIAATNELCAVAFGCGCRPLQVETFGLDASVVAKKGGLHQVQFDSDGVFMMRGVVE